MPCRAADTDFIRQALRACCPFAIVVASGLLTHCADFGSGQGPAKPLPTVTLSEIQRTIFTQSCAFSSCHNAAGHKGGLDLSSTAASHVGLVGVLADNSIARAAGKVRVMPGEPDSSFLITKLTAPGPGEGERMPQSNSPLPEASIQMIRDWIARGAPDA